MIDAFVFAKISFAILSSPGPVNSKILTPFFCVNNSAVLAKCSAGQHFDEPKLAPGLRADDFIMRLNTVFSQNFVSVFL